MSTESHARSFSPSLQIAQMDKKKIRLLFVLEIEEKKMVKHETWKLAAFA